jgi:peptidoglycan/LPS O-acetylase OafA/YrhL
MTTVKIERNNTLDLLRLMSAVFVILHHSYPLTGNSSLFSALGAIAVSTFFIISGYLISQSWFSDPTPSRFLWKRLLRIMPGLVAVVIFAILIIGPINTSFPLREYFFNINTWIYLGAISVFHIPQTLPGVFTSNPYPTSINGSLWTIPLEFRMYILLCIMGVIGMLKDRRILLSIVISSYAIYFTSLLSNIWVLNVFTRTLGDIGIIGYLWRLISNGIIGNGIPLNFPNYNILFLIGTLFYLYKDQIKFNSWIALGAFIGLLVIIVSGSSYFLIALFICLPYLALYLGQLPLRQLYNIGDKYGDYSYGLYIYAFPVQQTIAHFMPKINPIQMFVLSLPTTFILAFISWWLIEKKALSLKRTDPKKIYFYISTDIKNRKKIIYLKIAALLKI